jgi:2-succinyl-6-hydroxy-2,4-cyclohexadiene-1-carboxylate synthase
MLACVDLKQGPGIPLVFLHGFLGTSADWEKVCAFLPQCRCIGVDLPGHGSSPFKETFELPDFGRCHLIGYSMGGRLAMQEAARFPDRFASLIIASSHCGLSDNEEKQKRLALDAEWAASILPFDLFLKRWYDQHLFGGFKPDMALRKQQNPDLLAKALVAYSLGRQERLQPKNTTFAVGERDEKYRALFPNAEIVEGAAHMVHLENPKRFAQIIEQRIFS